MFELTRILAVDLIIIISTKKFLKTSYYPSRDNKARHALRRDKKRVAHNFIFLENMDLPICPVFF